MSYSTQSSEPPLFQAPNNSTTSFYNNNHHKQFEGFYGIVTEAINMIHNDIGLRNNTQGMLGYVTLLWKKGYSLLHHIEDFPMTFEATAFFLKQHIQGIQANVGQFLKPLLSNMHLENRVDDLVVVFDVLCKETFHLNSAYGKIYDSITVMEKFISPVLKDWIVAFETSSPNSANVVLQLFGTFLSNRLKPLIQKISLTDLQGVLTHFVLPAVDHIFHDHLTKLIKDGNHTAFAEIFTKIVATVDNVIDASVEQCQKNEECNGDFSKMLDIQFLHSTNYLTFLKENFTGGLSHFKQIFIDNIKGQALNFLDNQIKRLFQTQSTNVMNKISPMVTKLSKKVVAALLLFTHDHDQAQQILLEYTVRSVVDIQNMILKSANSTHNDAIDAVIHQAAVEIPIFLGQSIMISFITAKEDASDSVNNGDIIDDKVTSVLNDSVVLVEDLFVALQKAQFNYTTSSKCDVFKNVINEDIKYLVTYYVQQIAVQKLHFADVEHFINSSLMNVSMLTEQASLLECEFKSLGVDEFANMSSDLCQAIQCSPAELTTLQSYIEQE